MVFLKPYMIIMKRLILAFWCLPLAVFSQNFKNDLKQIQESEAKSALHRQTFRANANTGNYDLKYHKLELEVDPAEAFISGTVTSYFLAKENLDRITFELTSNMTVSGVTKNGNALSFTQNDDDEVVVLLPETQQAGVLDSLSISYSGNPVASGFGAFEQSEHNGKPIVWTLSEPYGAKAWWPCKQDLIDKIDSIDVYITTPRFNADSDPYYAVANGVELSQEIDGDFKTTRYKHRHPIPAYLIAMAVTNYDIYNHTVANNGNPFEIVNYVYPENIDYAKNSTPVTVDIMNLFTNLFEEYPYADEKYGHAQFGWGGGMEHTTVSFMGSFNRNLIAHELAHQWFGNKVTCGSWKDIWLNEGFATYLSGLVIEDLDGEDYFNAWKAERISNITSRTDGAVYLSDTDTLSVNRIFSSRLSYNKGAMVLHMLRKKLGDEAFYKGLKDYLQDEALAFGYAKTADLQSVLETSTGQDLTAFFNDWVYGEGYPSYTIIVDQTTETNVSITINQTQSHSSVSFFEVGVPIRLLGASGEVLDLVLDHTVNNQVFNETVDFKVSNALFDVDNDIISNNNNLTLGVSDPQIQTDIQVYPNPSNHIVYLEKPAALQVHGIRVYNALGQTLSTSNWVHQLDVSNYANGLLFVKIQTNKGVVYKTIIKN